MLIYRTQQPGDTSMTSYFHAVLNARRLRTLVIDDKLISSAILKIAATLAPGSIWWPSQVSGGQAQASSWDDNVPLTVRQFRVWRQRSRR